ncbi:DUF871 domain-containing protein [Thalassobacillus sp. CUG 92003]|uniref:DUF871 domain-containing protein n=1 Tax=Thalassobacillus sp. CUG 92003 TaxID=2736641 RepID=UPI0015E79E98|nr:MupG family TIM beta-alpha barrel fold protein [Thalassobacillus sp. CUG 92003]
MTRSQLGISIYPEHAETTDIKDYMKKAHDLGFTRIFTNLIAVKKESREYKKLVELYTHAQHLGFDVIADVAPQVFEEWGLSYEEVREFKAIGIDGLRLDLGLDPKTEAALTYDESGLLLELNSSMHDGNLEAVMAHRPNKERLISCHNFYPQKFTGLSKEHFLQTSQHFKSHGLKTAAFVSSQRGSFGLSGEFEGLPTIEEQRELAVANQAKWLWATGLIDDIIVGNMFASDEELEQLAQLRSDVITLQLEENDQITRVEHAIVYNHIHHVRGDISDYMYRSTEPRALYKQSDIPPSSDSSRPVYPGDILIGNNLYGRYKGELQIARKEMPADERKNKVGRVSLPDFSLLYFLDSWRTFQFMS